ncbi:MAG: glucan biosynthesis protein [Deltaproteobacteria bacterium]|nr:glucan biosynthesis protein [Deltaproteobacteria bacterium]
MRRRDFLKGAACLAAWGALGPLWSPSPALAQGSVSGVPFTVEWLKEEAKKLAATPFVASARAIPPEVANLTWDQYNSILYDPKHSLWRDQPLAFQIRLFHLGLYFRQSVTINEVVDGVARVIPYSSELFDYGKAKFDSPLPPDLGFAGFRVHYQNDFDIDLVAFLGASYFRATSGTRQYGMSCRGLAVETGMPRPEEFPHFIAFWLVRPKPGETVTTVHALMDSESVTGAYTFKIFPSHTLVMQVEATLFIRKPIERLGIAPLTSMFQCGENDRRMSDDFRPEIHDSDGLSVWTGAGEWIWRPLGNPHYMRVNSYMDENPRGFGLLQRDREYEHYLDDWAFYHLRPSVWVEPIGQWGRGAVMLVEIPTADETFDNIVAFWNPDRPIKTGDELNYAYRLHWCEKSPIRAPLAEVVSTRLGIGGIVGQKRPYYSRKFVIDFSGGDLPMLSAKAPVEAVITASRGKVENVSARPLRVTSGRRAIFDLRPEGTEPVDLRCFLRIGGATLTETWQYQWLPPVDQRVL